MIFLIYTTTSGFVVYVSVLLDHRFVAVVLCRVLKVLGS